MSFDKVSIAFICLYILIDLITLVIYFYIKKTYTLKYVECICVSNVNKYHCQCGWYKEIGMLRSKSNAYKAGDLRPVYVSGNKVLSYEDVEDFKSVVIKDAIFILLVVGLLNICA